MVVDCGGGTVDIKSYTVRGQDTRTNLLQEIGMIDGGAWGSAYVNLAVREKLLAERFGAEQLQRLLKEHPHQIDELEAAWERAKHGLWVEDGDDGSLDVSPVYLAVPGALWHALEGPTREELTRLAEGEEYRIVITPDEVCALFDEVVDPLVAAVERQLGDLSADEDGDLGVDQVVIVGGFARSAYLMARIRKAFADRFAVVQAQDPAIAVLGGAVHFASEPSIIWGRRSRYTYGFAYSRKLREGDRTEFSFMNPDTGVLETGNLMRIVVRRGEPVELGRRVSASLNLFSTTGNEAPLKIYAALADDPYYTDDAGCEFLMTVTADTSGSIGTEYGRRKMNIEFSFGGPEIEVRVEDPITGNPRKTSIVFEEQFGSKLRGRRQ
jgi:hypothetical protein